MRTIPDSELKHHVVPQDDLESGDADSLIELQPLSKTDKLKVWLTHGASLLKKHRLKIISFLVVCGFLICAGVITAQAVVILFDESSGVQSNGSSNSDTCNPTFGTVPVEQAAMVRHSSEYQLQFTNVSEMWANRSNETAVWAQAFSEFSHYVNITADDFYEVLFNQENAEDDACGTSDYFFKIRQYYSGSNYATSLNIKTNSHHSENDAASKPFWPSSQTFKSVNDSTFQKCERDVHECYTKYSRESSTLLQEHTKFSTCNDLIRLFPWAFPAMPYDDLWSRVSMKKREYWWLGKHVGTMAGTAFEIEITLQYSNEDDLLHETNPPTYGEWSIRVFTKEDGLSDDYDADVLADVEKIWNSMMTRFGNEEKSC